MAGCDAVIHLACISNDPSFDLDPDLGKSINYDCFRPLVHAAKRRRRATLHLRVLFFRLRRQERAGTSPRICALQPLTDYSKYKALCEDVLMEEREPGFVTVILGRPRSAAMRRGCVSI